MCMGLNDFEHVIRTIRRYIILILINTCCVMSFIFGLCLLKTYNITFCNAKYNIVDATSTVTVILTLYKKTGI